MRAGGGSPFTCRGDPLNRLNRCATQICLFFAWWLTYVCFHSFISQQAPPKGRPGLPARSQVEEKAKRLGKGACAVGPPFLQRASSRLVPFCPRTHPTAPALPRWVERTMLFSGVCLWDFLDSGRRCLDRRACSVPFKRGHCPLLSQ